LEHLPSRLGTLVVCALLWPALADAQPRPQSLPLLLDAVTDASAPVPGHAVRAAAREGRFNNAALLAGRIRVTLADGRELDAVRQHDVRGNRGNFSWVGEFEDAPGSLVVVTSHRGVVSGMLHHGSEVYELGTGRNGRVVLYQVDEARLPEEGEPIHVVTPEGDDAGDLFFDSATTDAASGDGLVVQDLLVVYTPKAVSKAGSVATLESRILNAVAAANAAYVNSQVQIHLNVVGLAQTNYSETGDMSVTLSRLRGTSDGYMDEVHNLRNQTGADLVALISEDGNYCGFAYVMSSVSSGFASSAFSVTNQGCFSNQTLAHEIGHNQGNAHDRANGGSAAHPYAYGYRTCDNLTYTNGQSFRTVMAYSCSGPRVNYFSNPNVFYNGAPMGVAYEQDAKNSADNARSMNITGPVTAGFRSAPSTTPPTAPSTASATALANDRIALQWADRSSDEQGFVIERAVGGGSFSQRATVGANTTSFTDTGLTASTTYHYRVRAYNGAGSSAFSNVASATTPEAPVLPGSPSPAAVATSSNTAAVSWAQASNTSGYEVLRETRHPKNGKWSATLIAVGSGTTSITETLSDGTYRYSVRAVNSAGKSDPVTAMCSTCGSDGSFAISSSSSSGGGSKGGPPGRDKK
jgi:peptidyl-Asp metalloendopeptidase